ncbi:MAG: phosphoglycerate kinase, partial [Patescibacteria group bacterium]|nr:phosphoglycerate kinase [Patescibacteria group bacterium]
MQIKSLREAEVAGKRVLVRVNFNVPIKNGAVIDDTRLKATLPTLEFLQQAGAAQIILITHLGRPGGKVVDGLQVAPIAARLRELTQIPFELKENLRFDPREEHPPVGEDSDFAKELATLGDVFVNDAFADLHRAHASIVGIPKFLPSFAGLLVEKEVEELTKALTPPEGALAI